MSPFETVTWEWKYVGRTPAVAVSRRHVGGAGVSSDVEVVSTSTFEALFERLDPCAEVVARGPVVQPTRGSASLASLTVDPAPVGAREPTPWIELDWNTGDVRHVVRFEGEQLDDLVLACLDVVRGVVLERVDLSEYTMPFWDDGEYGTLRTTASLAASVWVDGVPMWLTTPIDSLRLPPGVHRVRWVPLVDVEPEERDVTIHAGMTTSVDVRF